MIRLITILIIICITIPVGIVNAEEPEIYVVHPELGNTIDAPERDAYGLFPKIKDFRSATVYINPDGTYKLVVRKWVEGRTEILSREISKKEIDELALHIAYFDPANKNAPFITQPDPDDSGTVFFRRQDLSYEGNPPFKIHELRKPSAGYQVAAGVGGGLLGSIAFTGLGAGLFTTNPSGYDIIYIAAFYGSIGSAIGSSIGVSKASNCYPKGLYIASLFGACMGYGAGVFVYRMFEIEVGYEVLIVFPVLESIGASMFYNGSRNYKIRDRGVIAGQLSNNKIEYSLLDFNIKRNPFDSSEIMPEVKLVTLRF